jgi:hypothetical protein
MSYTAPNGAHFDANHIDFRDRTSYDRLTDRFVDDYQLSTGLGLLADGFVAIIPPNINESTIDNRHWIGWNSAQLIDGALGTFFTE